MHSCRCLSKGGNAYLYYQISDRSIAIRDSDKLRYDIFIDPAAPEPKGGIDLLSGDTSLRDSGAVDEQHRRAHGDTLLKDAVGKWITRTIDISRLKGRTIDNIVIQQEGDREGRYVQFLDNIKIIHADSTEDVIYADGRPDQSRISWKNGYSTYSILTVVPREKVVPGEALKTMIAEATAREEYYAKYEELVSKVGLIERFLKAGGHTDLISEIHEALDVPKPDEFQGSVEEYVAKLHAAAGHLEHAHPVMQEYTGDLVGHAHIDLQWLWEWPEGIESARSTFAQACKFMDEFPEFTFTQSSAALYEAMEQYFPDLFQEMKLRIGEGRFEPVGGRWCEGDTNMISAESHARHLLYGQRYFRSRFGKACTVGWEPDTFGHCWTMPSILKAAGIDSYYFCRGGKNIPLFWWEGPDGSRVLAFDEPATGSWYNADVTDQNIKELMDFYEKTGLKELLWVYGVGNHGGGPTREHIEHALAWQKDKAMPKVRFATAAQFFDALKGKDLSKLPVVKDELNPVFRGCYTTHGDVKRLNRDAEAALVTAETVALFASQTAYPYPAYDLARAWETVCINHHHDTLPGSGIHDAYENTHQQLDAVISKAHWITRSALRHIAARVDSAGEGTGKIVFNPNGWPRTDLVVWPTSASDSSKSLTLRLPGGSSPVQQSKGDDGKPFLMAVAGGVPPFGYAVCRLAEHAFDPADGVQVTEDSDGITLADRAGMKLTLSRKTGQLTSVTSGQRQLLQGGREGHRLEAHMEAPHGMSAWELGPIVEVIPLDKVEAIDVLERGPVRARVRVTRQFRDSRITQDVSLIHGLQRVDFDTLIDWHEYGNRDAPAPMLRVSFPLVEGKSGNATYSIPFGEIVRPVDGNDVPALTWASLVAVGADGGAALLNDSKHAHAATPEGDLRLTLIRASYDPDRTPDQYPQRIRYALVPCPPETSERTPTGGSLAARLTREGLAFNQALLVEDVHSGRANPFSNPRADQPQAEQASLLRLELLDGAVSTCLKRAEDDGDLILRLYQDSPEATSGRLVCDRGIERLERVNLIEDGAGGAPPMPASVATSVPISLKPFEIQTLKIRLAPVSRRE
jgi:alpha-mannosidase